MGKSWHQGHRKRSRDDLESSDMGLGRTLSLLHNSDIFAEEGPDKSTLSSEQQGWDDPKAEFQSTKKQKKVPLKGGGNYPEIKHSAQARLNTHVKISDLQNLVLYVLADGSAPQWCSVRHYHAIGKVVVLMAPGLEAGMFNGRIDLEPEPKTKMETQGEQHNQVENVQDASTLVSESSTTISSFSESSHVNQDGQASATLSPDDYYPTKLSSITLPAPLKPLAKVFSHIWPIKCPGDDRNNRVHSPIHAMLNSPLPEKKDRNSKGPAAVKQSKDWRDQKTLLSAYIASFEELEDNGYIIHPAHFEERQREEALQRRGELGFGPEDGWVDTKVERLEDGNVPSSEMQKGSLTAGREVLAIDCEMCKTAPDVFSLTRISVLGWTGSVIMDELVKPAEPITDYLTQYSGITEKMLAPVTTTIQDIQKRLLELIGPKTILIGHSLDGDLKALKLTHPFIVDTALLYPHPRGPPLKSSLKWLCQRYLSREIQKGHGASGHNSLEDARACLDLVRLKCEKGPKWGTADASNESIFKRIGRTPKPAFLKVNPVGDEMRSGAIVDWGDPRRGPGSNAELLIGCQDDAAVVDGIKTAVDGGNAHVDFIWARMRGLEIHRGWFNAKSTLSSSTNTATIEAYDTADNGHTQESSAKSLSDVVSNTVSHITDIWEALPPCTAFIVYSGHGDPRELTRLQTLHTQFRNEYKTKKWDELSVKWTDIEEQALRKAARAARLGIGFIGVK